MLRRLAIASIGVPGSESSAVNSQRIASRSSKPQSKSKVSVPHRPLTIWEPSRKAAGTASRPFGTGHGEEFAVAQQLLHSPWRDAEPGGYIGE